MTAALKEKLCLVNQVEINWDVRNSVILHLSLYSVGDGGKKKRDEETLSSAMCSSGVNTTKLCQFVGSYALHRWYFGMLVVTLVTTGKVGDPSTSVMQWEYSSLLFRAVKLAHYVLQPAAHCVLFPQQLNLHMYTFTVSAHRHMRSCSCTQW